MMMPVVVETGAGATVGEGDVGEGAIAAFAGPLNANAAATAAHGSASARSRREVEADGMGDSLPSVDVGLRKEGTPSRRF
jgi:hypothetical protein